MSCTFEKILLDVKNLTVKLKGSDEMADKIIKDTSYVQLKMKSMNELQDNLSGLARRVNMCDGDGSLVFEGKMENCNLESLRKENIELRELLHEYQTALELIMTRYRADMNDFMDSSDSGTQKHPPKESESTANCTLEQDLTFKYVQLYKAAIESTSNSEKNIDRLEKSIETLYSENEMMRNVLELGEQHLNQLECSSSTNSAERIHLNHITTDECKLNEHFLETSFSDDDRCSVSSDASSVKTLV